jgi:DNA uptake protein ComE-like DNA-binding protein
MHASLRTTPARPLRGWSGSGWIRVAACALLLVVAGSVPAAAQRGGRSSEDGAALVHPNTAAEPALAELPHLAPRIVKAILASRPFDGMMSLDAFLTEQGLTRQQLTELYEHLFIPIDVNSASDRELLMIPGMGNRLLAALKEGRPYAGLEQFRRAMRPLVDDEQLARLEQYLFVA